MNDRKPAIALRAAFRGLSLAVLLVVVAPGLAVAGELVMFETRSCSWCEAWDREVGGIYHKTPEAQAAPLRRVDLNAPRADDLAGLRRVLYSPTFVLLEGGREIGRIQGYPGADHFWGLLGMLLEKRSAASANHDDERTNCHDC